MKKFPYLLLLLGGIAHADDAELKSDQLVLPKGGIDVNAQVEIDLSKNLVGKPISLAPDIWYGVTDDLTLGLVHSTTGSTGLIGGFGDSLCLTGKDNGCEHLYKNVGLDARVRLMAPLSFDGGLYINDTDPFQLAIKLGISGRWHLGKAYVEATPNIFIGLTNRGDDMTLSGRNGEVLNIPITGAYEVVDHLTLALQVGFVIPFEKTGDTYRIPLSLAARYQINDNLGVGLAFTLFGVAGGSIYPTGVDGRVLTIGGTYAL